MREEKVIRSYNSERCVMEPNEEKNNALKQQLAGLGTLLQLEKQCRHAKNKAEFGFFVVNDTLRLLQYHQAVLWQKKGRSVKTVAVSGVDLPNSDSPYLQWLQRVCKYLLSREEALKTQVITSEQLPPALQEGWEEWMGSQGLWCPLIADGNILGGLWLKRDKEWLSLETALLDQLADAYAHAWQALLYRPFRRNRQQNGVIGRLLRPALLAAVLIGLAMPVEFSVLAPARIVPLDPLVISAPLRGVIKKFHVQPNQQVKTEQLLFELDDTELRNRYQVAKKALAVAQAQYQRAAQKSLSERDSIIDIDVSRARVAIKKAELEYAAEDLSRVEVRSERDGIVVFADVNDWLGKPVVIGEKVLLVADPGSRELEIQVPLDNAVNLEAGAKVRMFLHVDPARDIRATIRQTSYEAKETPQGTLAYIVKAAFVNESRQLRIGMQGTAKIYGKETRLYYYLLRRPWAALRRTLGI